MATKEGLAVVVDTNRRLGRASSDPRPSVRRLGLFPALQESEKTRSERVVCSADSYY
jgi:hypothetical protein